MLIFIFSTVHGVYTVETHINWPVRDSLIPDRVLAFLSEVYEIGHNNKTSVKYHILRDTRGY
jgi:hypothetical protein